VRARTLRLAALAVTAALAAGCGSTPAATGSDGVCLIASGGDPDSAGRLGCRADYQLLASVPLDASLPGATSVKTIVDRANDNTLYFQNSKRYCIH